MIVYRFDAEAARVVCADMSLENVLKDVLPWYRSVRDALLCSPWTHTKSFPCLCFVPRAEPRFRPEALRRMVQKWLTALPLPSEVYLLRFDGGTEAGTSAVEHTERGEEGVNHGAGSTPER